MVRAPSNIYRSWKPAVRGVFHATLAGHEYPLHCHDTWTVLLVDVGDVRYQLDKHDRWADPRRVTVLPPFVAHDGKSARPDVGFRKRVLYVDTDAISEELAGAAVDRSALEDQELRRDLDRLHRAFSDGASDFEQRARFGLVVDRINEVLSGTEPDRRGCSAAAMRLRAELDGDLRGRFDLRQLADELGRNVTHLIRSFTAEYGLPPHRYLVSRRIDEARRLLLAGMPAVDVAAAVGFHDQAHLTRHFRHHVGTTPGRYITSP